MGTEQPRIEQSAKRVRTYLGGRLVADTTRPSLVWDIPYYPTYYIPVADVRAELADERPDEGGTVYTVRVEGAEAVGAARRSEELPDLVRLDQDAMDSWFEEDEEVFGHPRSPYHRVDVLSSSRHVRIEVDGVTVAESSSLRMLFETGLPVRYYMPQTHVRMDLLEPTDSATRCPYKGRARYWSVLGHKDLAWSYPSPLPESQGVAGFVCFYDEKVDVFVDGVRQERPTTPF